MTRALKKHQVAEYGPPNEELKLNRVHISYPDSMREKLEEIRVATDRSSVSEVFRQALIFYSLAFEEHKKGSDMLIRNKDGSIERLRMFL